MTGNRQSPESRRAVRQPPAVSLRVCGRSFGPSQGVAGWVFARSGPHHRTAMRGPHARPGVVGHGPCHRPFSTVEATWSRPTGRGLLFVCRRDAVAAASETPSRERSDSLRRPGGTQSNRQFLPLLGGLLSDAGRHKRWESGANVYGAYPRPNGRGFAPVFHVTVAVTEGRTSGPTRSRQRPTARRRRRRRRRTLARP